MAVAAMVVFSSGLFGAQETKPVFDKVGGMDFRAVVRKAKAKVFPAVVYVRCLRESHDSGKKITQEVSGSGVIISAGGEVMTNWHVVDKATEVRCLTFEGKAMDAKVVGKDKDTDLALLQMKLPKGAKPQVFARFGDSDRLVEGDFVMAMGAPWGLNRSVSIGIISCTSRYLEKGRLELDRSAAPTASRLQPKHLLRGQRGRDSGRYGPRIPGAPGGYKAQGPDTQDQR